MRYYLGAVVFFLCVTAFTQNTYAQNKKFGLGVIVGEPTGISAKYWTSRQNAFDFGLGWSIGGDRISDYDGNYNGNTRVHFFDAFKTSETLPLYYGIGWRFNTGAGYDNSFAVRGVIGISWFPNDTPLDVFAEFVPSLELFESTGFGIDAGAGVRFYF